jgi:hypothetical protein
MDVRTTSKSGHPVALPAAVIEQIARQLRDQHPEWLRQLSDHPERFADLEVQVHQHFRSVADQLVASLLAQASFSPAVDAAQKK